MEKNRATKWTRISGCDPARITNPDHAEETILVRNMKLGQNRQFQADVIVIVPEYLDGGHDKVFLIQAGTVFTEEDEFRDMLESADWECDGDDLLDSGSVDKPERIAMNSDQGLALICLAAYDYAGHEIDYDCSVLVQVGLPGPDDSNEHYFRGNPVYYPADTSLWAILRNVLWNFNDTPEEDPKDAMSYNDYQPEKLFDTNPFQGMSRDIRNRADLVEIYGFKNLERDAEGNPKVYEHEYEHADCDEEQGLDEYNAPVWSVLSTCETGIPDACPECGHEISPRKSRWIGPNEETLIAMWKSFPALEESEPDPEPGI